MTAQEVGRGPICVRIAKVGLWHKPESAESSAIWSISGCNRTFSDPESTLQQCNTQKLTQSLIRLGLHQLHYIGLHAAEEDPRRPPSLIRCIRRPDDSC
jgi:hypothetical protein